MGGQVGARHQAWLGCYLRWPDTLECHTLSGPRKCPTFLPRPAWQTGFLVWAVLVSKGMA